MPKLSIIIPTFNSGAVLDNALDSIVSQTFRDWEVLIMDGVSTDDTIKIAQSYNDDRIRICSEPDKGVYDAMNKGIKKAKGEWLYFLGSDDYLLTPTVLATVFLEADCHLDVLYGDVQSPILSEAYHGEWSINNLYANRCHQAIFYKRILFTSLGEYNLRYSYLSDFEFNLRWFLNKYTKSKYIPYEIAFFAPGGISERHEDPVFWDDFDYIVLKYGYRKLNTTNRIKHISSALSIEKKKSMRTKLRFLLKYNILKEKGHSFFKKQPNLLS